MNKMKLIELIARHTRGSPAGLETHQFIPSDRLVDLGAVPWIVQKVRCSYRGHSTCRFLAPSFSGPKKHRELADLFLQKLNAV
jgi:hypothetical protein